MTALRMVERLRTGFPHIDEDREEILTIIGLIESAVLCDDWHYCRTLVHRLLGIAEANGREVESLLSRHSHPWLSTIRRDHENGLIAIEALVSRIRSEPARHEVLADVERLRRVFTANFSKEEEAFRRIAEAPVAAPEVASRAFRNGSRIAGALRPE